MTTFRRLLANTLIANVTNNFLWFALTFWVYLETRSVIASSIIGASYMLFLAVFGLVFGTFVDQHRKKQAMLLSSFVSLAAFAIAALLYALIPKATLLDLGSPAFWAFVALVLFGAIAGNLRAVALATVVTMLVPEDRRDRANGLVGTVNGVSFAITSVFSGLAIGQLGMGWSLAIAVLFTLLAAAHLAPIRVQEDAPRRDREQPRTLDLRGSIGAVRAVPGLLALIFFTTFNNFLGGVFLSLMDPYGLSLVSVEVWGFLWGFISFGFILGGILVARRGLGASPLRTLFLTNIVLWAVCIAFPLRSSIVPLAIGMFIYMTLIPVVEASEQTIIQRVVPFAKQGRVFGFAQSAEMAASPITSFLIGPIAQLWVIPSMTDGAGARAIGGWFGVGPVRGMALIFIVAGLIGLVVTTLAMLSGSYQRLSRAYAGEDAAPEAVPVA